jgi:hypothetical protein
VFPQLIADKNAVIGFRFLAHRENQEKRWYRNSLQAIVTRLSQP